MTNANEGVHPVVAGVDGSDSALQAVRWAAREAARRHAPLRLVHVCHFAPVRHPRKVTPPPDCQAAILEEGRHWLAEAAEAATRVVPDLSVVTDLREGHAADTLIDESRSAQLVVVGSRGLGGFTALLTGSVAVALSAHGHCPVVVVRASGVDDVPLVAVHTWQDTLMTGAWTTLPGTVDWDWLQEGEEEQLAQRLAAWRETFPQVEVLPVVERDRPARALPADAAGAHILVVGSRGRGALAGLGLGPVSESLVAVARTESP